MPARFAMTGELRALSTTPAVTMRALGPWKNATSVTESVPRTGAAPSPPSDVEPPPSCDVAPASTAPPAVTAAPGADAPDPPHAATSANASAPTLVERAGAQGDCASLIPLASHSPVALASHPNGCIVSAPARFRTRALLAS